MALLKMDLKMSLGRNGWKETYWVDRSSATPESYLGTAEAFGAARIALLCQGGHLDEISLANPLVRGHTVISTLLASVDGGLIGEARDVQDAAVRVKFEDMSRQRHRFLWLRGYPDPEIAFALNRDNFTARDRDLLTPFLAACLSISLVIHGRNRVGIGPGERKITDVRPNLAGTRLLVTCPTHGFTGGDLVTIRRCVFDHNDPSIRLLNREHVVMPVVAPLQPLNQFEVNVAPRTLVAGSYLGRGGATQRIVQTVAVAFANAERFGSRSTGAPLVRTRGRRHAFRNPERIF